MVGELPDPARVAGSAFAARGRRDRPARPLRADARRLGAGEAARRARRRACRSPTIAAVAAACATRPRRGPRRPARLRPRRQRRRPRLRPGRVARSRGGIGCRVDLQPLRERGCSPEEALFGEGTGGFLLSGERAALEALGATLLGEVGGTDDRDRRRRPQPHRRPRRRRERLALAHRLDAARLAGMSIGAPPAVGSGVGDGGNSIDSAVATQGSCAVPGRRWPWPLCSAACGGGSEPGTRTLTFFVAIQPGGTIEEVAARCTKESDGKYTIKPELLPNDATQPREQLVRRLGAEGPLDRHHRPRRDPDQRIRQRRLDRRVERER